MPGQGDWAGSNSLLSGLFGALQTASAQRLDTSELWQSLRQTAGAWAHQAAGGGPLPPADQLEATGREILSKQGVGILEVNRYRSIAGQWRTAKDNLHRAEEGQQLTAGMLFKPPWAQTTGGEQADRYRIRVNWQITPTSGDTFTKWSSYELTAPLASIQHALAQAGQKAAGDKYLDLLSGGAPLEVSDFEIEQV